MIKHVAQLAILLLVAAPRAMIAQSELPLNNAGKITVDGQNRSYLIRHLPVSSYPELPSAVAAELNLRGCLIPQTYEAHRPENVVHASLERANSSDWAVLCSVDGQVSLLVFFASGSAMHPMVLAKQAELERLQARDSSGALGFNWGIDPATPAAMHDAEAGMSHRPPLMDHDALADSVIDSKTVYHLYRNGQWEQVTVD